jgi:hypothetical protein
MTDINVLEFTPDQRAAFLRREIELKLQELSSLGVKHNLDICFTSPSGDHQETLVTRSFLIETLDSFGWQASSVWTESGMVEIETDTLSDRALIAAFDQHTGNDVTLGDWVSSSALC